jgi:X-Pro dipeptidyl-peptidase (S15 family)
MAERHVWIPMADGVRLAASPHLLDTADPCPVLLEALPYRKDDVTAGDRTEYRRLAGEHGYAVARVDLRGTGSSEGVATDEYPPQEQADLCRVIDWLAAQPWSTGAVGMYGTSYSGFNSLQVAAERPPALKAIVAIYATDDRYTDDVHYVGGALRLLDLVDYPLYMVALKALPPVPALTGWPCAATPTPSRSASTWRSPRPASRAGTGRGGAASPAGSAEPPGPTVLRRRRHRPSERTRPAPGHLTAHARRPGPPGRGWPAPPAGRACARSCRGRRCAATARSPPPPARPTR